MPRRERRHQRRSLLALSEAHDIAMLFPRVRPRDDVVEAFAARVACEIQRDAERIPPEWIEEGVALVEESERRRIVDELRRRFPDRWASLTAAAGDDALTERAVVASAVRGAVVERLPPDRRKLEFIEAMPHPASPCGVLVIALDPMLVWDRDDAIIIGRTLAGRRDPLRFWEQAHVYADARVEDWHVTRVCELAERIDAQLPVEGLERASELLDTGIAEVRSSDVAARWVAGALLAGYAHLVATGKIERR
jgi:hypothetical protein